MKNELILTEEQKESLKFYVTNDYLLVNALLWNEDIKVIKEVINIAKEKEIIKLYATIFI